MIHSVGEKTIVQDWYRKLAEDGSKAGNKLYRDVNKAIDEFKKALSDVDKLNDIVVGLIEDVVELAKEKFEEGHDYYGDDYITQTFPRDIREKLDGADLLEMEGLLRKLKDFYTKKKSELQEDVRSQKTSAEKKTVGINEFVKRQTKPDFAGTKVTMAQLEDLRKKAEQGVNAGKDRKGYADFVHIVSVNEPDILCNIAKITPQNEKLLKTEMTKRREGEEEYEHRFFESKDVKGIPSHHVDIILYTKEQLDKEGEKNTGSDFDIISINAEISEKGAPIAPVTMRRNIKGPASGGSGHQHTEEEIGESEKFWEQHALIK